MRAVASILNGIWAMHKDSAQPFVALAGDVLANPMRQTIPIEQREAEYAIPHSAAGTYYISEYGEANPPENAPKGSIAIIGMSGAVTKYDQSSYGPAGTITKNNLIQRALANPNVSALILMVDSPGGEAGAGERIAQTIRASEKPVYALVDGLAASAMYEIVAAVDKIFAVSEHSMAGSIGTFITIADYSQYFERIGIKVQELYAEESTEKNAEVREALKGKPEKLQAFVNAVNETFLTNVRNDRGNRIVDDAAYSGKIYRAKDAISAGLIDGIATLDQVVGMLEAEINISSSINQITYIV